MDYRFSWVIFNMINNISDQASSFPGTQLNQSDNFLDSLREFFAILNPSRKGELSTWDTIYLHLILAINADSDLIKMMCCSRKIFHQRITNLIHF